MLDNIAEAGWRQEQGENFALPEMLPRREFSRPSSRGYQHAKRTLTYQ